MPWIPDSFSVPQGESGVSNTATDAAASQCTLHSKLSSVSLMQLGAPCYKLFFILGRTPSFAILEIAWAYHVFSLNCVICPLTHHESYRSYSPYLVDSPNGGQGSKTTCYLPAIRSHSLARNVTVLAFPIPTSRINLDTTPFRAHYHFPMSQRTPRRDACTHLMGLLLRTFPTSNHHLQTRSALRPTCVSSCLKR